MRINYVTTNSYKFELARKFFEDVEGIELVQYDQETPEIQEDSVEKIAASSALWAAKEIGEPAVAMDVGFCINALNGFPGPFVKYINKWLQPNDILRLMDGKEDRSAYFVDALAYATPDGKTKVFTVKTEGIIVRAEGLPDTDWTVDAVFVPNGYTKTLAEMDEAEKSRVWSSGSIWEQLHKGLAF